jgi:hypothetical protein
VSVGKVFSLDLKSSATLQNVDENALKMGLCRLEPGDREAESSEFSAT